MNQPWRNAALLAGVYALLAGAYIAVSGQVAAESSGSVEDLRSIELLKGIAFVLVTALLLFGGALALFLRSRRATLEVQRSRLAFLAAQRRATAGLFAATVAHDFKNVLMVVTAGLSGLELPDLGPEERAELLGDMREAVARGTELARRLGVSGRPTRAGELQPVDVSEVVRSAAHLLRTQTALNDCDVRVAADGPIMRRVYPALVHQLVVNLTLNAMEAAGRGGRVEVGARPLDDQGVEILVEDSGPGVPPELREQLFDAFYTTRDDGIGLGLLSVRMCADTHGGRVEIGTSDLGGARFRVVLGAKKQVAMV